MTKKTKNAFAGFFVAATVCLLAAVFIYSPNYGGGLYGY